MPPAGTPRRYSLLTSPTVRHQLAEILPAAVAFAAHEFIAGPLLDNPQRVGKRLSGPLADRYSARRGTYRIIYRIDVNASVVTVLHVAHRSEAYRFR